MSENKKVTKLSTGYPQEKKKPVDKPVNNYDNYLGLTKLEYEEYQKMVELPYT